MTRRSSAIRNSKIGGREMMLAKRTKKITRSIATFASAVALSMAFMPAVAFAADDSTEPDIDVILNENSGVTDVSLKAINGYDEFIGSIRLPIDLESNASLTDGAVEFTFDPAIAGRSNVHEYTFSPAGDDLVIYVSGVKDSIVPTDGSAVKLGSMKLSPAFAEDAKKELGTDATLFANYIPGSMQCNNQFNSMVMGRSVNAAALDNTDTDANDPGDNTTTPGGPVPDPDYDPVPIPDDEPDLIRTNTSPYISNGGLTGMMSTGDDAMNHVKVIAASTLLVLAALGIAYAISARKRARR